MIKTAPILLVEDHEASPSEYFEYFQNHEYPVQTVSNIEAAIESVLSNRFNAVIFACKIPNDVIIEWMAELKQAQPNILILAITETSNTPFTVKAIKVGVENVVTRPVDMNALEKSIARHAKNNSNPPLLTHSADGKQLPFFGANVTTTETLNLAKIAATSTNVVLLLGETGTGKGVLARWIHEHSNRAKSPFVEVNCSSLKGELLRSELFGHARGAFTSAVRDKEGLLETANTGTLFLDEIGDMDAEVQVQLLKTIEDHTFRRVGENTIRHSNFRLICATNRDLLAGGPCSFRQDLYYRICVFPVHLKGLREKKDEIIPLCEHMLTGFGYSHLPLETGLQQQLQSYAWPGNARELRNMLERALMLAQGTALTTQHFPSLTEETATHCVYNNSQRLDDMEDVHILQVVTDSHGNIQQASKALGLSVSSLYRRLSRIRTVAAMTGLSITDSTSSQSLS